MHRSRLTYYLASIPTLLIGVRSWSAMLVAFLGLPRREPLLLILRPSGLRFLVQTAMDIWVIKETCLDRDYEKASVPLRPGWTVVDIGAALGDFTVQAARHPGSRVYAYEPSPTSFALLQRNVALNHLTNVVASPLAVSGVHGDTLTLYVNSEAVQHSTVATRAEQAAPIVTVATTSLDQLFHDQALHHCDYLKIDCEGAEFDIVFNTSPATLGRITHICLEYHDGTTAWHHTDLVRFFQEHGFRTAVRPNPVHAHLGLLYAYQPGPPATDDRPGSTQG